MQFSQTHKGNIYQRWIVLTWVHHTNIVVRDFKRWDMPWAVGKVGTFHTYVPFSPVVLFSLFITTLLVAHEHVVFSGNMPFWPHMSYYRGLPRKWPNSMWQCHFVCIMNICKHERTFLLKENAHKVSQGSSTYSKALVTYGHEIHIGPTNYEHESTFLYYMLNWT